MIATSTVLPSERFKPQADSIHIRELVSAVEDYIIVAIETVKPKPEHDLERFVTVKVAMVMALIQEIAVIILGDAALTAAQRVQEASEKLMRICTRAIYVLGLLGLGLGLFAAITGIKSEAAD